MNHGDHSAHSVSVILITGFLFALILNVPLIAMTFERNWPWAYGFIFTLLGNGLECFITFFHEIGHSLAGWFYGVPTIPMFDFAHGGGWAWMPVGQQIPVLVMVWAAIGYGFFVTFRDWVWIRGILIVLFLFNLATAFSDWHETVFDFMGPGFEPMVGAFFLIRALYDLAPRGGVEWVLNAVFGFALPIHALINGWGLMHNAEVRRLYWTQKDAQGSGDFDKIADRLPFGDFNGIVMVWMGVSVLCLIVPFVVYMIHSAREEPAL